MLAVWLIVGVGLLQWVARHRLKTWVATALVAAGVTAYLTHRGKEKHRE